jgi:hypothetical protein
MAENGLLDVIRVKYMAGFELKKAGRCKELRDS